MFFAKFKSQMLFWCLSATCLCIFNLIENVSNFDVPRILINILMVFTLAFVLYAISYPFVYLFGRLRASRLKCLLFLLLIGTAVFSPVVIHDADANQAKKGAMQVIRNGLAFVGLVGVANQIDDAVDAVEDAAYDLVYGTARFIWEEVIYPDNTPDCGNCQFGCSSCPPDGEYVNGHTGAFRSDSSDSPGSSEDSSSDTPPDSHSGKDSDSETYECSCGATVYNYMSDSHVCN